MDDELRAIVEAQRSRNREAAVARAERLARARAQAPLIAAELARIDPAVTEVWLFGSVATGRVGRDRFDIDLVDLEIAIEHVRSQRREFDATLERAQADFDPADPMAWAAVGFTLHNLYNAMENYFLRVAKFFENQIEGSTWHRDLVDRMGHQVPALRPALLSGDQLEPFHELRAFRHTYRSLYDRKLDPRRVRIAADYVAPAVEALETGHRRFTAAMAEIAEAL